MGAAGLHVVGALNIFLVAAQTPPFTVGCQVIARWLCCTRVRVLALGVARMLSWVWVVSLAPRGGAQEEGEGRGVHRSTCWSEYRMYIGDSEYLVLCELAG